MSFQDKSDTPPKFIGRAGTLGGNLRVDQDATWMVNRRYSRQSRLGELAPDTEINPRTGLPRGSDETGRATGRAGQTILAQSALDNVGRFLDATRSSVLDDMPAARDRGALLDGRPSKVNTHATATATADDDYGRGFGFDHGVGRGFIPIDQDY
jgi:hypothetical protein